MGDYLKQAYEERNSPIEEYLKGENMKTEKKEQIKTWLGWLVALVEFIIQQLN